MYPSRKISKMTIVKRQKWPAILITLQNYSENYRSLSRTENLVKMPSLITRITSLLLKLNSLFLKKISLLSDFKFPVNFRLRITQTPRITSNHRGIRAYS